MAGRQMAPVDPTQGLHQVKRQLQKTFIVEQCRTLLSHLDDAIDATLQKASLRSRSYLVDRAVGDRHPRQAEAALEQRLYEQSVAAGGPMVSGVWPRLVGYQVNLPTRRDQGGWRRTGPPTPRRLERAGQSTRAAP